MPRLNILLYKKLIQAVKRRNTGAKESLINSDFPGHQGGAAKISDQK